MGRRSTSARLVGRDGELTDLLAAIRSGDREHPVILVAGEAGIGKTRLLSELVEGLGADGASAAGGPLVARGSCLRLAEGDIPFAPILEILDAIRGRGGATDLVAPLRAALAGSGPEGVRSAEARTRRFIEIHDVLVAASAGSPFVIVIDDLHWADRSTLDLVLFLARRLRGSAILLMAAYRSDELHRRHPLRPVVAELSRGFVRERIELGPLGRAAVVEQIGELHGSIDEDVIGEIVARADGNPFYVEELVALGSGRAPLPASVRDVLLARLASLDAPTMRVLAACAVVGREVDEELLQEILDLEPGIVAESLRTAGDQHILVPAERAGGYRFRHALLEEAVHDDLLPGDRVELHRRVAAVMQGPAPLRGTGAVSPGELARHLDLGGQPEPAIEAYLDAAEVAFRALAWTEGTAAYERAAELAAAYATTLDNPPDRRLRDLVIPTAIAMSWTGAMTRSIALLRASIARMENDPDPSASLALWVTLTRILNDTGDEAAANAALATSVRLLPPNDMTAVGVDVLISLAAGAWIKAQIREAVRLAERAVAAAERINDPALLFLALVHRAEAIIALGDVDRGLADIDRARRLEAEHGWLDTYGHLATNGASALAEVGFLKPALELWQEALRTSRELGIARSWDPWNLPGLALCAFFSGRWADADGPIAVSRAFKAPGMPTHFNEAVAAVLAAGRGDLEACERAIAAATEHGLDLEGDFEAIRGFMRAARADAAGDPERRLVEAEAAIRSLEATDAFVLRSRLAVESASAAADLVASLHPRSDAARVADARERARSAATLAVDLDEGRTIPGTMSVPWTRANAALAAAEAARAEGHDDPAAWTPIAEAFDAMGFAPHVAYATFRAGAAVIAARDRHGGEVLLRKATDLATSIGMTVLLGRIHTLARAARIDLRGAQPAPSPARNPARDPWALSAREREVLVLLADGRTNGEIGARLFISTKTASVHVTHILDKLGVSTRTEAALLASRAGLLEAKLLQAE